MERKKNTPINETQGLKYLDDALGEFTQSLRGDSSFRPTQAETLEIAGQALRGAVAVMKMTKK